jgi:hypothetical protein
VDRGCHYAQELLQEKREREEGARGKEQENVGLCSFSKPALTYMLVWVFFFSFSFSLSIQKSIFTI